ncbi:MAG TPA: efflux RND transporter periplasmic adaptor subunit [Burkholderiales bacterium]|nr:efflux RND transporter periplasmic adaptor subunit [Burkholderiales bacterium]
MDLPVEIIAAALALVTLGACSGQKQQPAAPQPPEVSVVTVRRQPVPVTVELPGRTNPYLVAQVRARVDGIVLKREFKEGSDVKTGQRLYQIDPAPYRAALDSALGTLANAQATIASTAAQAERYKVLADRNAVAKQDYDNAVASRDQAVAQVASAKAAVETARINLGYTDALSPISGRIGISQVTEGAYVQAGAATLMATVQQIDPIYVDLTQSSAEGLRLRRDVASGRLKLNGPDQAKATLVLEDGTEYPEKGALQFTDITVDQTTGSVTLRAIFPNPHHLLLPGMFVRARIDEGVNDNAVLVPEVGVTHDPKGQATALVVGPDGKVATRAIQATRTLGDSWVIEGGLADGEQVIVSGVQKVQPGMAVRTVAWQAPAAPGGQPAAAMTVPLATPAAEQLARSTATR